MTTSNFPVQLFSYLSKAPLKFIGVIVLSLFLVSCGEEIVRTESEYADIATEAHAAGDSRLAIFELAAGIRNYPRNAQFQILRGKIFLDLEDGSAAEIAFEKAIALGYDRAFIKHEIAESWLYQRKAAKLIEVLEKEITLGTNDPLVYEVVGRAYIAIRNRTNPTLFIRNMNKAEEYIEKAYSLSPNNTRVLITKAWLSALLGKIDEALGWLDQADTIIKDQRLNLDVRGELLVRQNNLEAAEAIYTRLIAKFPQYPQYKLELGNVYILTSDYAKAHEWVAPVLEQYPGHLRAKILMANISLMERLFETAKQLSAEVLVALPNNLQATIVNGASSYFLNDLENAHLKLNNFYNRTKSRQALKLLAATKLKLGENDQAVTLLENAGLTVENQTDSELLQLVAIASAATGRSDVALEAFNKLADQNPGNTSFSKNSGLILIAQGNFDEGFETLDKALAEETDQIKYAQGLFELSNKALEVGQYDRAAQYIEDYKGKAPDDYKAWVQSAVLQSLLRNLPEVHRNFKKAMALAPNVAEIKARYAIFYEMQGERENALALAHEALTLDPSNTGAGKLILSVLIQDKKFDEVKTIVDQAIKNYSASGATKLIFADYYTMLGRPQETLNILDQLSDTLKASPSYQIIASKAYLRGGQAQRAVGILEKFTQQAPNNVTALKFLLHGYLLTQDQGKYLSTLEKIDTLDPRDFENQITLAKLYITTEKYNQAEQILLSITATSSEQIIQLKFVQAGLATNLKDYKKALEILATLHDQYPKNSGVSMLYIRNLANDGQTNKAINIAIALTADLPNNLTLKRTLGDLYLLQNDNENARIQYEAILASEVQPNTTTEYHAHNNLAIIYLELNLGDKALEHSLKSLDMAPNNPAVVDTYAQILMFLGQANQAIVHFNQALALLPSSDRSNRSLFSLGKAKALIQTGQTEQAGKILDRLVKDDPDFDQIGEVKRLLATLP